MFNATRERFQTGLSDIPMAKKAYRLRVLDRMLLRTDGMKKFELTGRLIEQAVKECGKATKTITMCKMDYKSALQEMMEDYDC